MSALRQRVRELGRNGAANAGVIRKILDLDHIQGYAGLYISYGRHIEAGVTVKVCMQSCRAVDFTPKGVLKNDNRNICSCSGRARPTGNSHFSGDGVGSQNFNDR
jgi:hypothetical protein